ncbi:DUF1127 domain-containing protein [Breoghania sp. L-A4]|uniref:DUF1127 domain-containing protein n=1 Tax=Breoghania sp. L-A4 TaxID=2304600 RepID=UPI000E3589F4|nr:DUF1127 domain-containing protein [Breoghania sp. L-A4]AXS40746.1 DUF1127 domain-containing protein [Breoghania sp. L-A4]
MIKTIARAALATATTMLAARRMRRKPQTVHGLSDAELTDIGLTRYDIGRGARRKASWPAR